MNKKLAKNNTATHIKDLCNRTQDFYAIESHEAPKFPKEYWLPISATYQMEITDQDLMDALSILIE